MPEADCSVGVDEALTAGAPTVGCARGVVKARIRSSGALPGHGRASLRLLLVAGVVGFCVGSCGGSDSSSSSTTTESAPGPAVTDPRYPDPRDARVCAPSGEPPPYKSSKPSAQALLDVVPLKTKEGQIVDRHDRLIKLASVNWYGAESAGFVPSGLDKQSADAIAHEVRTLGFNSVRLPWSNYMLECNPKVQRGLVSADPAIRPDAKGDIRALYVFDHVVNSLADQGLIVILDNHGSDPTLNDANGTRDGLWHNDVYSTDSWLADWHAMAARYKDVPAVIGADLRNEPSHSCPSLEGKIASAASTSGPTSDAFKAVKDECGQRNGPESDKAAKGEAPACSNDISVAAWGSDNKDCDWLSAAEEAGSRILQVKPSWLIMVEGVGEATDLHQAIDKPITCPSDQPHDCRLPNQVVFSPHIYCCYLDPGTSASWQNASAFTDFLDRYWGKLDDPSKLPSDRSPVPIWVGEFGTCNGSQACLTPTSLAGLSDEQKKALHPMPTDDPKACGPLPYPPPSRPPTCEEGDQGVWFDNLTHYLASRPDVSWSYWPLNGTLLPPSNTQREPYGVLNVDWNGPAPGAGNGLVCMLKAIGPDPSSASAGVPAAAPRSASQALGALTQCLPGAAGEFADCGQVNHLFLVHARGVPCGTALELFTAAISQGSAQGTDFGTLKLPGYDCVYRADTPGGGTQTCTDASSGATIRVLETP